MSEKLDEFADRGMTYSIFPALVCVYQLNNVDNDLCNPTRVNIESTDKEVTKTTVFWCNEEPSVASVNVIEGLI